MIMTENLKEHYTVEEATSLINQVLSKYGESVKINFRKKDAEITDSFLVTNEEDRHFVCKIITRTGVTNRTFENLSAEWQVHNVSYCVGFMKEKSKDVSLDYADDPRKAVKIATEIFDKLDIE